MNNRLENSKGMTIVEILVSVIIISLVMGLLFTLLIQVQKVNSDSSRKSTIMISQNVITKAVERDMFEIGVKAISACSYKDFNITEEQIDLSEGIDYSCTRIEYNQSYDMADLGYILIYKQSSTQDNPSWVMRYARGYYTDCVVDSPPSGSSAWKETYSVVQKLDPEVELRLNPAHNAVNYSASYLEGRKYSEQKLNNANLYIPIMDDFDYHYDIDLSFSFRLNFPNVVSASNEEVTFTCASDDSSMLQCTCYGGNKCDETEPNSEHQDATGKYLYTCSESKASLGSVVGMNKNFINLQNVNKVGITSNTVKSVKFYNIDTAPNEATSGPGIDISYSQNGTVMMYYDVQDNLYDLKIMQSGGVKVYGSTLEGMFQNFTNLVSVDFNNFISGGIISMNSLFYNCPSLQTINGFDTLNLDSLEDVSLMFYKCSSLTTSPFKNMNLPSVRVANSLFNEAGLTGNFIYSIDFNAPNVVSLRSMLRKTKITTFTIEDAEFNKLKNISNLLSGCTSLTKATIKNTNAPELLNMEYTFDSSTKLTSLELNDFYTPILDSLYGVLYKCSSLSKVTLVNFDTSKVTRWDYSFASTSFSSYEVFDISILSFESATSFSSMFESSYVNKVQFGNEETPDGYLDGIQDISAMFRNASNFKGFAGKEVTFKGAKTAESMFDTAGSYYKGFLDVSNMYLENCINFNNMFNKCYYTGVDLSGIHSKVTSEPIEMKKIFYAGVNLQYFFLCDAEFKSAVNLSEAFKMNKYLTFVKGVEYLNDDSLSKYYRGEFEYELKDGTKYPFENFMVGTGYATSLNGFFEDDIYLRGMPDGFLEGIKTNKDTDFTKMFKKAFSEVIPAYVDLSEEKYYEIYQLVIPFTGMNSSASQFEDCTNIAVLEFKNSTEVIYDGSATSSNNILNLGKFAHTPYITLIIHDFTYIKTGNTEPKWGSKYFGGRNFATNGKKLRAIISDNCTIGEKQKTNFSDLSFDEGKPSSKVTIEIISKGCPSLNQTVNPA